MALSIAFALSVLSAGFVALRISGLAKGTLGVGLAAPIGLAVMTIGANWLTLSGAPPVLGTLFVYGVSLVGLGLLVLERSSILTAGVALWRQHRQATTTLVAAVAVPVVVMGFAFADAHVPLSPHDGAIHVELISAAQRGGAWVDWYPPGMGLLFAAWLAAVPWVDRAEGALQLGMSLPPLAVLAFFGLGVAVWRDLQIAAVAALLLSFTYVFPYYPQLWSGWPLSIGLTLLMGVWSLSLGYIQRPSSRLAVAAGLLLGGIVLVHATELYTLAIILLVTALGAWRCVAWRRLPLDLSVAAVVAAVSAAPYLPMLLHWAGVGGAYSLGLEDVQGPLNGTRVDHGAELFVVFGLEALGIDLPLRVAALAVGIGWVLRRRVGRSIVVLGLAFGALALAFSVLRRTEPIGYVYAITYPWGTQYRIFMLVALAQALVAAAGGVAAARWLLRWRRTSVSATRRIRRTVLLVVMTWIGLMAVATYAFVAYPEQLVLGYNDDDAAAMEWLKSHASPGELVANDTFADGGIWAPFKAGVGVVFPKVLSPEDQPTRALILENIARLDQAPEAAVAACALHVGYVYYGARVSGWDVRQFPPLEELRGSPALEQVFRQGTATVFRLRLNCR